jgi:murein DD-endopeptidase MepM/ murein hydrolase activator NlpD
MRVVLLLLLSLLLVSCAATRGIVGGTNDQDERGVWHRVMEGQTLWRIAKTYRLTLEELKDANDLADFVLVAEGTWLFIPKAEKVLYVQGNGSALPPESKRLDFVWPLKGEVVRAFGKLKNDFNLGIDLKSTASRNVVASERGTVILSSTIRGYGNTIIIEHEDDFCTLYAKGIESMVREGQEVERNSVIARVDAGRGGNGDVLHYELFFKGKPVNPLYYLP